MSGTAVRFPAAGAAGRVTTFLVAAAGVFATFFLATGFAALLVATRGRVAGLAELLERFATALGLGAGRLGRAFFFEETRFFAAAFRPPLAFLPAGPDRRGAFFEARLGVRAAFRLAMARPFVVDAGVRSLP